MKSTDYLYEVPLACLGSPDDKFDLDLAEFYKLGTGTPVVTAELSNGQFRPVGRSKHVVDAASGAGLARVRVWLDPEDADELQRSGWTALRVQSQNPQPGNGGPDRAHLMVVEKAVDLDLPELKTHLLEFFADLRNLRVYPHDKTTAISFGGSVPLGDTSWAADLLAAVQGLLLLRGSRLRSYQGLSLII